VSAEGGPATVITELGPGETGHFWPSFLPDGTHYMYLAWSDDAASRAVYLGTLDAKDKQKLIAEASNATYAVSPPTGSALAGFLKAAPGYIFFHRGSTLFARPFNAKTLAFIGEPLQVAGSVDGNATGRGLFDVSQTGALIYHQGTGVAGPAGRGGISNTVFAFTDRLGNPKEMGVPLGPYGDMDLSPDGTLIAVTKQEGGAGASNVFVWDWRQAKESRLTKDPIDAINPVWTPDGKQNAFTSSRNGHADIHTNTAKNVGDRNPTPRPRRSRLEFLALRTTADWPAIHPP